ncbi:hypothetical protein [Dyadobacter sandarakinus]|uniref:Antitoxin ParD1/3/4 n=1 Tax=Dyadobacter sandarakinus TaxID=2747268 RepID=A0ABX7IAM6_9BACT|nr:hypothetical protein [Dyadobacter sandarakinus]QRR03035.1 hypothetical protein HWI92_20040 [Dyadobacter sandarakinus]
MGKLKTSKTNLTFAGNALSEEKFKNMIREVEKGPFVNMQEMAKTIDKWKSKYAK